MLSKAQNKYIRSLTQQKFRYEYKVFVAEGEKIALEWLRSSLSIKMIVATDEWASAHHNEISRHPEAGLHTVKAAELETLSSLQTTNSVLLVIPMPMPGTIPVVNQWYLALDHIQDPGNMGTIMRIADWFGINHIVCSPGCADVYNPKVVQSAMGGHLRVNVYETELLPFLSGISLPKYAATLDGDSAYLQQRAEAGVLIIGNESKGISEEVLSAVTHKITIPRRGGAESLNAAVSAGILCALLLPH
jgi:RNA methyltransferase, TrmH family